tara:strand:- start:1153 stop:1884 length:732 start_codon:yes stop_codon:yes gene_type:complete
MKILSIDIGMKNLSYLVIDIEYVNNKIQYDIITWDNVNVMHSYTNLNYISLEYNKWKKRDLLCCIDSLNLDVEPSIDTKKLNKKDLQLIIKNHLKCNNIKKQQSIDYQYLVKMVSQHFDSVLKNVITDIDQIIIENQPCFKNPKMKSMQMIVFTYFCLIPLTKYKIGFISATEKLKYCKSENFIKIIPTKYTQRKQTSVDITLKLLNDRYNYNLPNIWKKSNKKDDLSDVFLQSLAHFKNISL